jgi:hypothetical protein
MACKAPGEGTNVGDVLYTYGERDSVARAMHCMDKQGCAKRCERTEATHIQHTVRTENICVLSTWVYWRVASGKCSNVV